MLERRARREFSEEFKKQIVSLYNSGKSKADIQHEYDLGYNVISGWIKRVNSTGSTTEKDNRSPKDQQFLDLAKENKILKMENDILKQAALIMARK